MHTSQSVSDGSAGSPQDTHLDGVRLARRESGAMQEGYPGYASGSDRTGVDLRGWVIQYGQPFLIGAVTDSPSGSRAKSQHCQPRNPSIPVAQ